MDAYICGFDHELPMRQFHSPDGSLFEGYCIPSVMREDLSVAATRDGITRGADQHYREREVLRNGNWSVVSVVEY
jgi:hypothetical protein